MEVVKNFRILRYKEGKIEEVEDSVVVESFLNIYINGKRYLQTPYTPKSKRDLVFGILFSEGFIKKVEDVLEYKEDRSRVYITLKEKDITFKEQIETTDCFSRRLFLDRTLHPLEIREKFNIEKILSLIKDFQNLPSLYKATGGTHSSAIAKDKILFWSEDISRRNSIDKVIGTCFLAGESFNDKIMIVSCRIPSEVILKMVRIGIPVIVSISSPTDRAITIAQTFGVTLCGFARGKRMNIYSSFERLI